MNIIKKIISLLCVCLMLISTVTASAVAVDTAVISADSVTVYQGNNVTVNFYAENFSAVGTFDFEIFYDSSAFSVYSTSQGSLLSGAMVSENKDTEGRIFVSAMSLEGINGSGSLFSVRFTAKSEAAPSVYPVVVAVGDAYGVDLQPMKIATKSGSVEVLKSAASNETFNLNTKVSSYNLKKDDITTVTVRATSYSIRPFMSATFELEYDRDLFEVVEADFNASLKKEDALHTVNKEIDGVVKFSYASLTAVRQYELFYVKLRAKEDTDASSKITYSAIEVAKDTETLYTPYSSYLTLNISKTPEAVIGKKLTIERKSDNKIYVGDSFVSQLKIEADSGIAAGDFTVYYDKNTVGCDSVSINSQVAETNGIIVLNPKNKDGVIKFSYVNEKGLNEAIALVDITWTALDTSSEHYELEVSGAGVVDAQFETVPMDYGYDEDCIYFTDIVLPNCIEKGYSEHFCKGCGDSFRDTYVDIDPDGHSWNDTEKYLKTAETCLGDSVYYKECMLCAVSSEGITDETWTKEDTRLGHSWIESRTYLLSAATCLEDAVYYMECEHCGISSEGETDEIWIDTGSRLGHLWIDTETYLKSDADCFNDEVYFKECSRCGISSEGETDETWVKADTKLTHTDADNSDFCDLCDECLLPIIESGFCGTNVTYKLYEKNILILSGTGSTSSYSAEESPFFGKTIERVIVREGITQLNNYLFYGCAELKDVKLPSSLRIIGNNNVFEKCTSLEYIEIPEGVKIIRFNIFKDCTKLRTVILHEGLEDISVSAFSRCSALENIVLPESLESMYSWAFAYCTSLKTITIPTKLKTIGQYNFYSCTGLESVVIPETVEKIENNSFYACNNLKAVFYGGTEEQWDTIEKAENTGLENVNVYFCHLDPHSMGEWKSENNGTHKRECLNIYPCTYTETVDCFYGDWIITKDTTCSEKGSKYRVCSVCGYRDNSEIDMLAHTLSAPVQENYFDPNCTLVGRYDEVVYCTECHFEVSRIEKTVDALGHSWKNTQDYLESAATCLDDAVYYKKCERCNSSSEGIADETWVLSDSKLGHAYESVVTAPTCETEGYTTYTCSRCSDGYISDKVEAIGHNYEGTVTKEPTCTEKGEKTFVCKNDAGHTYTEDIEALGHDKTQHGAQAPTCTGIGWVAYETCSRCDYTTYEEIVKLGHDYESVVTAPTCETEGYTTYTCSRCADSYVSDNVSALGHNYEGAVTKDPTCTEKGEKTFICKNDSKHTYKEDVASLGHDKIQHSAKASTCTEIGWNAYETCSRCDYTTYEEIDKLGHDYESVVTAPTCETEGYTTYTCSRCADSYVSDKIEAIGHNYEGTVTKEPTCTEKGEKTFVCKNDASHTYKEDVAALGHNENYHEAQAPTCTEIGWNAYEICSRCDYTTYEEIDKLGHDYESVVTAPTCETEGYTTYTCSRCADSYVSDKVSALGHKYEGTVTRQPTCTEKGENTLVCKNDASHTYTEDIKALGHNKIQHSAKAPTCTEIGWEAYETCSRCDYTTYEEIDKLGHDYESVVTASTCEAEGYTTYTCLRCSYSYISDKTEAIGHSYEGTVTKEPTCTEKGEKTFVCKNDASHTYKEDVAPLGHTDSDNNGFCEKCSILVCDHKNQGTYITDKKEENCTQDGYSGDTHCNKCKEIVIMGEKIPAHGHRYAGIKTAPTCETEGYTTYTCSVCADEYVSDRLSCLGHDYAGEITKTPTCTEKGETTYICKNDSAHFFTEEIDALGHDYIILQIVAPTCENDSYTTHVCTRCDYQYNDSYTPKLGHDYSGSVTKEPTCTEKGEMTFICKNDSSHTYQEDIAPLGHTDGDNNGFCDKCDVLICDHKNQNTFVTDEKAETCTQDGYTGDTHCDKCKEIVIMGERIPAHGHRYEGVVTAPTCEVEGYTTYTCSVCYDNYTGDKKSPVGHDYETNIIKQPTCTEKGEMLYICQNDAEHSHTRELDALGHKEVIKSGKAPTCTENGWKEFAVCERCDYTTYEEIAPKGHSWINSDRYCKTPATCTADEICYMLCADCEISSEGITDEVCVNKGTALGHDYAKYTYNNDATCTENGTKSSVCTRCSAVDKITAENTVKGHKLTDVVAVQATLTQNGRIDRKCSDCGFVSKKIKVSSVKTITLSATSYIYDGKVKTPSVTVKDSKGVLLKSGTDYNVSYSGGRKNTGKYSVTITLKGKYKGTKTLYLSILPAKTSKITSACNTTSIKASWNKVTGADGYKVELLNSKGKVIKTVTTTKTSYSFKKLSKVTTYKIRVTAYKTIDKKAAYSAVSTVITTSTAPAKTTLSKVSAASKSAKLTWKKVSGASGYEIQYSTSSKFKSAKTATVKKGSTVKSTIKKLKKGKKYYFRVRAYKTVSGNKVYGVWSSVKSVKVK